MLTIENITPIPKVLLKFSYIKIDYIQNMMCYDFNF